ncbi:uncharacterized protein LOC132904315 [Amyelois transitella]|uniref:uncharacterized protein LOC132904315 n=1 Tax=Amyelois transitella TaxID=680683 RepID=UPI00298FA6C2|nr:uncharacterized protein LOC132904315 [Amyelois transitella]
MPLLSTISSDFGSTGVSAMDTARGMLRGRPYGGVALLWRRSVFQSVEVIECNNPRICAKKVVLKERSFLVMCVYMPMDDKVNFAVFTDVLSSVDSVRWGGALSQPYRLECGVRQGGLSSPTLFNLYVNELIEELSSASVGCCIDGVCVNNISYADDMALLSASACGLRTLLKKCELYALSHGLLYNVKKSQVMVFGAGSKRYDNIPPVRLYDNILQRVYMFKYLGHVLTPDLKDDSDIKRERRALSVRANMLARRFARCSREVKIALFRAFCTSFYTCSLWARYTQKAYNALRVQYNNAFRVLLGLPCFCSASGMYAEARVDCFYATMRKRCASLVRRMRGSGNSVLTMIAGRQAYT